MSSSSLFLTVLILPVLLLVSGCTDGMKLKMDSAWEAVDPMGHRKEHQMRYYPRGQNSGMRLPDGYRL